MKRQLVLLPSVVLAAFVACDDSSSSGGGGGFTSDGGTFDASLPDGAIAPDGSAPPDAGGPVYNDMTQAKFWSAYDVTQGTGVANAKGYEGAVFDGRYLYLAPYTAGQGIVARYDTQADFATAGSWTTFDTKANVDPNAKGFAGGTFDGRYVYFAPRQGTGNVVTRYDTQADFATAGSWKVFTTTSADANASGYVGAVFDGHYVYFVPYNDAANLYHGTVLRYDTTADFQTGSSWKTFDTIANVDLNAKGFYGGVFDGRYLYLVPWKTSDVPTYGNLVARYDTTADFQTATSWKTYDTTKKDTNAKGFSGGAFDGRYLYLVPAQAGVAVRYDTKADFATDASWGTFDLKTKSADAYGFTGATFDGRYVYFAPYSNTTYDGLVARYDTQADFAAGTSWSTFDTTSQGGVGFIGSAFDGRYVYMVPCCNSSGYDGTVLRFDAKTPPSMPDLYGTSPVKYRGSFL